MVIEGPLRGTLKFRQTVIHRVIVGNVCAVDMTDQAQPAGLFEAAGGYGCQRSVGGLPEQGRPTFAAEAAPRIAR